jgi:hypothetical protein
MRVRVTIVLIAAAAALPMGMLPDTAGAGTPRLPRLYSAVVMHGASFSNVFSVRPRSVVVDSADGGELVISWMQWRRHSASGRGAAHPDHGSYPIKVSASDVIKGVFTHLTVNGKQPTGRWYAERLVLADLGDSTLTWAREEWVSNPESGLSLWPN